MSRCLVPACATCGTCLIQQGLECVGVCVQCVYVCVCSGACTSSYIWTQANTAVCRGLTVHAREGWRCGWGGGGGQMGGIAYTPTASS